MKPPPKPEEFIVQPGERGEVFLECPTDGCRWDASVVRMTVGELLTVAHEHSDQVHDRCDARVELGFGAVGDLEPYRCDRKQHNDIRHTWVAAS